jgi:S-adenosyl-L-methionine hydrolase (adenosine-forming)
VTAWISFTTDYGLADGFVAACHGVIARLAPSVRVIDVSHAVPPGDIARGSAVLADTVGSLPEAVHLAVVDPGVGTSRRAVAVQARRGVLVGPDNGLLIAAIDALGGAQRLVELTNAAWFAPTVSPTFHGRDIFAPVAARLALGADLAEAGTPLDPDALVRLPAPVCLIAAGLIEAEVHSVDQFGNVQLAAPGAALAQLGERLTIGRLAAPGQQAAQGQLAAPGQEVSTGQSAIRGATFGDAQPGLLVTYVDSAGKVAIAVRGGRANVALGVSPGDLLRLTSQS